MAITTVAATVVDVTPSSNKNVHMVTVQEEGFGQFWMWDAKPGEFEAGQPVILEMLDGNAIGMRDNQGQAHAAGEEE